MQRKKKLYKLNLAVQVNIAVHHTWQAKYKYNSYTYKSSQHNKFKLVNKLFRFSKYKIIIMRYLYVYICIYIYKLKKKKYNNNDFKAQRTIITEKRIQFKFLRKINIKQIFYEFIHIYSRFELFGHDFKVRQIMLMTI